MVKRPIINALNVKEMMNCYDAFDYYETFHLLLKIIIDKKFILILNLIIKIFLLLQQIKIKNIKILVLDIFSIITKLIPTIFVFFLK